MTDNVNSFRRVLTNSPVYTVGDVFQSGAGILLLPIYTRFLSTEEYGTAVLTILVAGIMAGLSNLNIQGALVRFTFDAPDDWEYLSRLYGTVFTFTALLSMIFLGVGTVLVYPIFSLFGISSFWLPYAYLGVVIAGTKSNYTIMQSIMQVQYESRRYVAQQGAHLLLAQSVTLILMVWFGVGGLSMVIGLAVTSVCFYAYSYLYALRNYGLRLDRTLIRSCIAYSIWFLPNRYAAFLPRVADRFFLTSISVGTAGLYSVGIRLGEGLSYLSNGFFRAHSPWFYAKMRDGSNSGHRQITYVARIAILVCSLLAIMVSLFAEEAIRLTLGSAYQEAWKVVPFAAFLVVFTTIKDLWVHPITYEKRAVKYAPIATYAFAGLSIGLMAWMVPAFGILGAAGAILAARFFSSFVMLFVSLKVQNIGYPVLEIYTIALGAFALSTVAYLPVAELLPIKLAVAFASAGLFIAMTRRELLQVIRSVRRESTSVTS